MGSAPSSSADRFGVAPGLRRVIAKVRSPRQAAAPCLQFSTGYRSTTKVTWLTTAAIAPSSRRTDAGTAGAVGPKFHDWVEGPSVCACHGLREGGFGAVERPAANAEAVSQKQGCSHANTREWSPDRSAGSIASANRHLGTTHGCWPGLPLCDSSWGLSSTLRSRVQVSVLVTGSGRGVLGH